MCTCTALAGLCYTRSEGGVNGKAHQQSNAGQCKAKQCKATQSKAKHIKAKQCKGVCVCMCSAVFQDLSSFVPFRICSCSSVPPTIWYVVLCPLTVVHINPSPRAVCLVVVCPCPCCCCLGVAKKNMKLLSCMLAFPAYICAYMFLY